jgi:NADH dehydrogenase FAD-containing subunit
MSAQIDAAPASALPPPPARTKTVAVLGASYGGIQAARTLAEGLPPGWRVLLIDRNRSAPLLPP